MKEFKYNPRLVSDIKIKIACWWFGHTWETIDSITEEKTNANGKKRKEFYNMLQCKRCKEKHKKYLFSI